MCPVSRGACPLCPGLAGRVLSSCSWGLPPSGFLLCLPLHLSHALPYFLFLFSHFPFLFLTPVPPSNAPPLPVWFELEAWGGCMLREGGAASQLHALLPPWDPYPTVPPPPGPVSGPGPVDGASMTTATSPPPLLQRASSFLLPTLSLGLCGQDLASLLPSISDEEAEVWEGLAFFQGTYESHAYWVRGPGLWHFPRFWLQMYLLVRDVLGKVF